MPVEEKFGQIFPARSMAKLSEWCESGHCLMLVAGFRHGTPTHTQSHPRMTNHPSIGYSPCPPRPELSQRHPCMASHPSIGYSSRPPRPQVSQRHSRMASHSSVGYSPRRPRPQVSQRHPRMTNHPSVGYSPLPKYLQVRWMDSYGGGRVKKKVAEQSKTVSHSLRIFRVRDYSAE